MTLGSIYGMFLFMSVDSHQNVTWDFIGTMTIKPMYHILKLVSSRGSGCWLNLVQHVYVLWSRNAGFASLVVSSVNLTCQSIRENVVTTLLFF